VVARFYWFHKHLHYICFGTITPFETDVLVEASRQFTEIHSKALNIKDVNLEEGVIGLLLAQPCSTVDVGIGSGRIQTLYERGHTPNISRPISPKCVSKENSTRNDQEDKITVNPIQPPRNIEFGVLPLPQTHNYRNDSSSLENIMR
jgi:hypothetical protein